MDWQPIFITSTLIVNSFFIVSLVVDAYFCHRKKNAAYTKKETLANVGVIALRTTTKVLFIESLYAFGLLAAAQYSFVQLPVDSIWIVVLCFLGVDFLYYWDHRAGHEINAIWAFHSVHHSSDEFNVSVSARLSFIEGLYRWIFLVPLALLGFPVFMILSMKQLSRAYQIWVHTVLDGDRFEKVNKYLVTPGLHRVHHGSNAQYLDKNYGAFFSIWDRMFGTFEPQVEPAIYGLIDPINTKNPFAINFIVIKKTFDQVKKADSITAAIKFLLARSDAKIEDFNSAAVPAK